ncbi:MAG: type II toxin-antitoxin system VapC family toxin [Lachnospiraceae bacterium]|nr:type II toxin-antitoxin system VapC family toxin [Lachnospiraceae bacterium]
MKILIDTHIAIWAVLNDPKLPEKAKELLLDIENEILYSTASIWEITIKHMLHPEKLRMNGNILEKGCENNGYTVLPILNAHVSYLETLKRAPNAPRHNDPFDRIMIAQAKAEKLMFLTHDSIIPYYEESFIITV